MANQSLFYSLDNMYQLLQFIAIEVVVTEQPHVNLIKAVDISSDYVSTQP